MAVVNETFARLYGRELVGRSERLWSDQPYHIAAVVEDIAYHTAGEAPRPYVYLVGEDRVAQFMRGAGSSVLIARVASGAERDIVATAQRSFRERFPYVVPPRIDALRDQLSAEAGPQRLAARIALSAGAVELALAAVGLYGLLLFGLLARTREIGLRLALGAERHEASWAVLRDGLRYAAMGGAAGVLFGVPVSILVARTLAARATDPIPFLGALAAVLLAAAAAAYGPARRAAQIEPAAALRHD